MVEVKNDSGDSDLDKQISGYIAASNKSYLGLCAIGVCLPSIKIQSDELQRENCDEFMDVYNSNIC